MKRRIKLILTLLTLSVVVVSSFFVYSHLTDKKDKGPINFEYGDISYSIVGDLEEDFIYPGKNIIITPYKILNNSTIDTEVRIRIDFYFGEDLKTVSDLEGYLEEEGFDLGEQWYYDEGFYYYKIGEDSVISPLTEEISLFNKLIFDGNVVKNAFENTKFKIKLTLHAKQKDNVEWSDLGSKFI